MTEHFRPDHVARIGGARRRRWTEPDAYHQRQRRPLTGTTVGIVIAAAVCAGLAAGLSGSKVPTATASATARPDPPILWNETQRVPTAAASPEDAAWLERAGVATHPSEVRRAARGTIPFFGTCHYGGGTNCVVDGDTFYHGGTKIRIANIDAPETHPPRCADEARLGVAATVRLRDLLNSGEVSLARIDRDEDVYGRKLRNVAVGGSDVGEALVGEGLARRYAGGRKSWCA